MDVFVSDGRKEKQEDIAIMKMLPDDYNTETLIIKIQCIANSQNYVQNADTQLCRNIF